MMKALEGKTRLAMLIFSASHILFSFVVDFQAILSKAWIPSILQAFLSWYAKTLNDPFFIDPRKDNLLWFRSLVFCEMTFQVPFFIAAVHFFQQSKRQAYPRWFQYACIAYGSHTATTMAPILSVLATNPYATFSERVVIVSVYFPYLVFPLWILVLAVSDGRSQRSLYAAKIK
jgi:hypothetical protein